MDEVDEVEMTSKKKTLILLLPDLWLICTGIRTHEISGSEGFAVKRIHRAMFTLLGTA